MRRFGKVWVFSLGVLLASAAAWAQEKEAAPSALAPQIETVLEFLVGWGRGNWDAMEARAGDQVTVKVQGTDYVLDIATRSAEAKLIFPFRGLSTVRVSGSVKGVTVEHLTVQAGGLETQGSGTVTLEETDGTFTVTSVAVE